MALTAQASDAETRAWAVAFFGRGADASVVAYLREARADPWLRPAATWALKRIGGGPPDLHVPGAMPDARGPHGL